MRQRVIPVKLVVIIPCAFVVVALGIFGVWLLTSTTKHGDLVFSKSGKGYSVALRADVDRSAVTSITIPADINGRPVVAIASKGFINCTGLRTVIIPDSVKRIDSEGFKGSTSLVSVLIPASVGRIDAGAFSGCTSLMTVYIARPQSENLVLVDSKSIFAGTPLAANAAGSAMYFSNEPARDFYRQAFDWPVMPTNQFLVPVREYDAVIRYYSETGTYLNEELGQVMRQRAVDFSVDTGESVLAAMSGTIISIDSDPYLGTIVTMQHSGGITSRYSFVCGNISDYIWVGRVVAKGAVLGQVTGSIPIFPGDGPMVRFEMTMGGRAVNPAHFAPIV